MNYIGLLLFSLQLVSCSNESGFKKSRTFVGGQTVSADILTSGKHIYTEYCMACHGEKGDGNGPAAKGSIPAPRNFTQGLYKFGLVDEGGLPTDEDFYRIIRHGLNGTAMLKWDISKEQTFAVTQYIKTFAPQVWENPDTVAGKKSSINSDPYTLARKDYAIEKGKEVYHMVANCQSCHRGYVSKPELSRLNEKYNDEPLTEFDGDLYNLKLQESEYYFYDSKERYAKYLPPDFTWHEVRSANTVAELAMRLVSGVTGSGMPAWKGTISDDEIWAVAYYVRSLMDLKTDKVARKNFYEKLRLDNAAMDAVEQSSEEN
jgi:mono/diheme cytochrome c family protein